MQYRPKLKLAIVDDPEWGMAMTADQVIVSDDNGVDTGILDANGAPLYRYRDPVGFRLEK